MIPVARASLAQKVSVGNLAALLALASILIGLYQYALASYADRQAQKSLTASVNVAWDALKREGETFRVEDGKLYAGPRALNGAYEIVDRVQAEIGGVATIFMGDTRVATNVKKPDGSRAVGTKLAPGPVYDAIFKRHESYRGAADILGASYFTAYDPIFDKAGAVIGILFVGALKSDTHAEIADIQNRALVAGLVVACLLAAGQLWLSGRLFAPLGSLRAAAQRIAGGELSAQVAGLRRRDDIGDMARALEDLRRTAEQKRELDDEALRQRERADAERRERERENAQRAAEQEKTLARLGGALRRVAAGDLAMESDDGIPDAYRPLVGDFNVAVGGLRGAIGEVRLGSEAVAASAGEVAAAAQSLHDRTERDAQRIESSARALDQLAEMVARSSELAAAARAAAEDAGREAGAGGDIAMRAGEAMHGIEVSSREIRAVLSLINEIAFQTNLLALNAGVEAARAGDAGAGFAVVASEVRALAQRSGEASKQIAALIAACDAQVATGVARVGESREALQRIIAKVTEVSGMFGEIARGAQEQSGKLGALGSAVGELETSVQQNATLAEETNASSRALSGEAERLFGSIGRFRLPAERGALRRAA